MNIYALYKGDDLLVTGTAEEIAKHQKISKSTVYFYQTPSYKKRMEKRNYENYKILVKIKST